MTNIISLNMEPNGDMYEMYLSSPENEKEISIFLPPSELCNLFDALHCCDETHDHSNHRYSIQGITSDDIPAILTIDSDTTYIAFSTQTNRDMILYKQASGQGIFNSILPYVELEHVKKIHKDHAAKVYGA